MRFEFPFNEALLRKHSNLIYREQIVNHQTNPTGSLILGCVLVLTGAHFVTKVALPGAILSTLAVVFGYAFIVEWMSNHKIKKAYNHQLQGIIDAFKDSNKPIVWEFRKDSFLYRDYRFQVEINWHQLLKLAAHQEYLVIYFKLQHNCGYYLEKTELSEEDFQRVISFVQEKQKQLSG